MFRAMPTGHGHHFVTVTTGDAGHRIFHARAMAPGHRQGAPLAPNQARTIYVGLKILEWTRDIPRDRMAARGPAPEHVRPESR